MFKRVVLKISGEGLAGDKGSDIGSSRSGKSNDLHFDAQAVDHIVDQVIEVIRAGVEVSMVVGGGNFWRGRDRKPGMDKVKADQIGMLGTIMNGIYLAEAFLIKGLSAHVMTPFAVNGFTEPYNRDAALKYMADGEAVIFAGGTGHPFFSTDSIVALRACELSAEAVLYGKSIDGVYDSDPNTNTNARKYKSVTYKTVVSNNLEAADITAVALTQGQGIPSLVFELSAPRAIAIACENNDKIHTVLGGTIVGLETEEDFYV